MDVNQIDAAALDVGDAPVLAAITQVILRKAGSAAGVRNTLVTLVRVVFFFRVHVVPPFLL